ncbi:MAG: trypsin-like peptidase domain-containing protein [Planctomycetes bacterium]|nr:trypsin-like peptidase domain-containing protein [Planctomycetota bacterium]
MDKKWHLVAILVLGVFCGLVIGKYYEVSKLPAQPSPADKDGTPLRLREEERQQIRKELQTFKENFQPFTKLVKCVQPSVVSISTKKTIMAYDDEFFWGFMRRTPQVQTAQVGSGVIIDDQGYILTNNHVVQQANEIKVTLADKREFIGKVVGSDALSDIAVVKINAPNLHPAVLGDSDKIEVGEWVVAIGSPFGLGNTVTLGIVSARRGSAEDNQSDSDYPGFIQTDAAINPGNSGGPLVAISGDVVGINSAIITQNGGYQGVGFAIPINRAKYIMKKLIEKGKVTRPFLGVEMSAIDESLVKYYGLDNLDELLKLLKMKEAKGAFVLRVQPRTAAEKAGLMEGDVVIEIGADKIDSPKDLTKTITKLEVGGTVDIKIIRNGKQETVTSTVGERK